MITRWAIQDYLESFRWRNIKEKNGKNFFWIFYFMILLPAIVGNYESRETALSYYCITIPIFYSIAAQSLHTSLLPKMMYLCPTSREMRKSYVQRVCMVRITAPMLVGVVGVAILLFADVCDGITGMGILLNVAILSISLGVGIFLKSSGKVSENGVQKPEAGLLEIFILVATMIISLLYASWLPYISTKSWLKWSFLVGGILLLWPMVVSYWKRWPEALERIMKYENR